VADFARLTASCNMRRSILLTRSAWQSDLKSFAIPHVGAGALSSTATLSARSEQEYCTRYGDKVQRVCRGHMQGTSDQELFELIRRHLFTAVVGDILDREGRWHQFLPQPIKPLNPAHRIIGRAFPVQIADVAGTQSRPFGCLTEALDSIAPGEVYLATGGSMNCAAWGEILTATARTRGGAGAVINGYHRDTPRVLEQDWPVFSRGSFAQDAGVRSSVVNFRCTVEVDGVLIEPRDLIFADIDGVLVIPKQIEERVIRLAIEKVAGEKVVRKEIEAGSSSTSVFDRYGIL
jgi:4-hydroxy-4-methyl-2-oxoglutarate aldolase